MYIGDPIFGKYYSRTSSSSLIVAIIYSCAQFPYSKVELVDIVNEGDDARCAAAVAKVKEAFARLHLPWQEVLPRLSVACGDGVYAAGGQNARHAGPRSFESVEFWEGYRHYRWAARRKDGRADGRRVGRTEGQTNGRTVRWADGRTGERTGGRTVGRTNGQTNGCEAQKLAGQYCVEIRFPETCALGFFPLLGQSINGGNEGVQAGD